MRVEWATPAADFDLYLWDAASWPNNSFPNGTPLAQSKQTATNFEQVEIPAVGGTRQLSFRSAPPCRQARASPARSSSGRRRRRTCPVVPPGNATRHRAALSAVHPDRCLRRALREPRLVRRRADDFWQSDDRACLLSSPSYEVLRVKFDDSTSPAKVTWEPKDTPTNISTQVDARPAPAWAIRQPAASGRCSSPAANRVTDYSDDDGETWTPTLSGGFAQRRRSSGHGRGTVSDHRPGLADPASALSERGLLLLAGCSDGLLLAQR